MSLQVSLREHWPEYLIEMWALATFMLAICVMIVAMASPESPLPSLVPNPWTRAVILALAIGVALTLVIQSPWGKRSGSHMNPAITLAFFLLGKIKPWDALFYIVAQFMGGLLGVLAAALIMGPLFTEPPVQYAMTNPGAHGVIVAFAAEAIISFALMQTILIFVASPPLMPYTGVAVGALVALFIVVEAPLSGASMNPARTLATALPGGTLAHLWVYLLGPTVGMLAAAQVQRWSFKGSSPGCAKLVHSPDVRCIHCGYTPKVGSGMLRRAH